MSSALVASSTRTAQIPVEEEDIAPAASRQPSGRASRKELVPVLGLEVEQPGLEVVETPPEPPSAAELAWLRGEQERVQERRDALLRVQALEEEEERIRRRIAELEAGERT